MALADQEFVANSIANWSLGTISSKYETGGRGVIAISTGNGDYGGVSYGAYQLSSNQGTLSAYLKSSGYSKDFQGLTPGSADFDSKWTTLATQDSNFGQTQHDYIKSTHYTVQLEKTGVDLKERGIAVQEMVWSTSVQFGPNSRLIENALLKEFGSVINYDNISDSAIVAAVQDYKIDNNERLFAKSSEAVRDATLKRAIKEKIDLLKLDVLNSFAGEENVSKAAGAAAQAEAEKQERGNRLLSQSIISAGNYTMLSLQQQLEQQVDTSYQSLSEASRLARAERNAAEAKAAADAEAASQAAREAFRASETAYTNSQGSSNSGWGGWTSGPDQSSAESARLSRSGYSDSDSSGSGDPIFIDLDDNGIELYSRNNSPAQFDFDDDGYAETTAWAGPQDGILVIDEGNDNQITQSKEIAFAKWTAAEGDTDLEGLAATFDSNHDGVLDARDQRFADFKVWKDANSNGVVDAGEMQTLAQAGIKSFNLKVKDGTNLDLEDGSVIHGLFDIQRADGKTIQGADVSLAYNDLGYRTRTDANGNTVVEFESGSALHYRNIGASEGNANFNLGTEADATVWIGASGNSSANILNASSKTTEVLLDGGAGDDTLLGGSGDDILLCGEGADQLQGGAGNDQLFVDGADIAALSALTGAAKATRINGGDGYDSLVVLDNSQLNLNLAIKTVASRAIDMGARGRFCAWSRLAAANNACWRAVA
jgi:hypothetical protein